MPIEILMPALSPTMTEGNLAKWLKQEGDTIAAGDAIAEIETDKATMEVEAVDEGVLGRILVPDGTEGVAVNQPIALLLEEGEDTEAIAGYETKGTASPELSVGARESSAGAAGSNGGGAASTASLATAGGTDSASPAKGERIFASPLARRMAQQAGLDLAGLKGSGPNGRIVRADVEAAISAAPGAMAPAAPAARRPAPTAAGPGARQLADALGMSYRMEPNTNTRKTIARRLSESKQTVPHFYLTIECVIDDLLAARKRLNADNDLKVSVNDFVIKAAAAALVKVPAANASWDDEGILYYDRADISVAVATPSGLITPIVTGAESKGLAQISGEMKDLAARAREGQLKPEEYQGGTFTVSNLGMYGIKEFAAIINPPQGCILAVGAGVQQPVARDGELTVATVMSCTLSVDHRVVDGAVGAEFLAAFRAYVENPVSMLL
ncbi:MAG: pyruvate dehydrogenase complex dihydrolipoamide acetyltransferase [Rhodospirillales bacterium]|nr:MAG: pyruvate dehydrogenase complex dihydrolipoamide acetyltransferase [Rhodospirillales bacterium]